MSRYLIISYYYAPLVSARAFRWHSIAREWVRQGHHVDVVCAWLPGLDDYEVIDGVHIHRDNTRWVELLRDQFIRKPVVQKRATEKSASPSNPFKRLIKPVLLWLYNNIYSQFYWPDGAFLWYFPARKQVKSLMNEYDYDAIISVSLYFTGHLVGEFAHHRAVQLPWLVDMGDPFSPMKDEAINNAFYRQLNHQTEARILQKATVISVTTEGTIDLYRRTMDDRIASKMVVIPPLLSVALTATNEPRDDKIRFVFTGTLYATIRRPDFLLAVFDNLLKTSLGDRLELHFYGYTSQVEDAFIPYQDHLDKSIFVHGTVSRDSLVEIIAAADILTNIGNTTAYQLPSKVVEYVSTGKRILNIALIDEDSSARFFEDYPLALTLSQSLDIAQATERLFEFLTTTDGSVPQDWLDNYLAAYRPPQIANRYLDLLNHPPQKEQS